MVLPGELRIPARLVAEELAAKNIKALRFLTAAKLVGHRCEISDVRDTLGIKPRTCQRLIAKITEKGWAGTDGLHLFPRSWKQMKFSKRGGLYLSSPPFDLAKFEALCFATTLKRVYRKRGGPHSTKRRVMQQDFPARYLCRAMQLSDRRFERLKATAQKYGFISVNPRVAVVGWAREYDLIRKNLKDLPVFRRGKYTVVPEPSNITFHV